jgi:hypothetical protein
MFLKKEELYCRVSRIGHFMSYQAKMRDNPLFMCCDKWGPQIFHASRGHLQILGTRRVMWGKLRAEDP